LTLIVLVHIKILPVKSPMHSLIVGNRDYQSDMTHLPSRANYYRMTLD